MTLKELFVGRNLFDTNDANTRFHLYYFIYEEERIPVRENFLYRDRI